MNDTTMDTDTNTNTYKKLNIHRVTHTYNSFYSLSGVVHLPLVKMVKAVSPERHQIEVVIGCLHSCSWILVSNV